jgi:hypothetical protein
MKLEGNSLGRTRPIEQGEELDKNLAGEEADLTFGAEDDRGAGQLEMKFAS